MVLDPVARRLARPSLHHLPLDDDGGDISLVGIAT